MNNQFKWQFYIMLMLQLLVIEVTKRILYLERIGPCFKKLIWNLSICLEKNIDFFVRDFFLSFLSFLQFKDHDWRASEQVKLRVDQKLISNVGNNAGQISIQNKRLWKVGPTSMPNVFHSFHCILSKASNFFRKVSFC